MSTQAKPPAKPRAKGSRPASGAAAAPTPPQVSKHQAFAMERLHRSKLATAAYNPRTISESAKAKLKQNLKKVGLLEPLIWNRTTGTLLGGHQRLACLDALEGKPDYLLDVAVVELTPEEEKAQNVALNNPNLQGEYDLDMLAELLKAPDLDLASTGLDLADVQVMFDDPELATLFTVNEPTAKALSAVEEQAQAAREQAKKQKTADRREMLKKEGGKSTDDTEVYAVVLFKTREEREAFVGHLGYGQDERYVDGGRVMERLDAAIPKPKAPTEPVGKGEAAPKAGRTAKKVTAPSGVASSQAEKTES